MSSTLNSGSWLFTIVCVIHVLNLKFSSNVTINGHSKNLWRLLQSRVSLIRTDNHRPRNIKVRVIKRNLNSLDLRSNVMEICNTLLLTQDSNSARNRQFSIPLLILCSASRFRSQRLVSSRVETSQQRRRYYSVPVCERT